MRTKLTHLEEPMCVLQIEVFMHSLKKFYDIDLQTSLDDIIGESIMHQQEFCDKKGDIISFVIFMSIITNGKYVKFLIIYWECISFLLYDFDKAFRSCFECSNNCKSDLDEIKYSLNIVCNHTLIGETDLFFAHSLFNLLWKQYTSCEIKGKL